MKTSAVLQQVYSDKPALSQSAVDDTEDLLLSFVNSVCMVLIDTGIIDKKKLRYARRIKSKLSQSKSLLLVLQDLEYVDRAQLLKTLRRVKIALKLGDLLVELGYIKATELRSALSIKRDRPSTQELGPILLENRYLSEDKLLDVLSVMMGVPKVDPDFSKINDQILRNINPKWCLDNRLIPMGLHKGRVVIAAIRPQDEVARQKVRQVYGEKAIFGIAKKQSVVKAIKAFEISRTRHLNKNNGVGESDTVKLVNTIIMDALEADASDVHVEPMHDQVRVRFRCDGVLIPHIVIESEQAAAVVSRIKVLAGADIAERRHHQDGRIEFKNPETGHNIDIRASFFVTIHGEKVVLRILSRQVEMLSVEDLGLPPRILESFYHEVLDAPSGVVLITGPTGSGKTTTLYSCINYLNNIERCIITAEDPVEYQMDGIAQCSLNGKIDLDYESTLTAMVRQDPDVIVLGEIRDSFSADTVIQAALTGHKVLSTFHTEDTVGSLIRLVNMDIEPFLISSTVVSVLAQRLLRKVCPKCAKQHHPTATELKRLGYNLRDFPDFHFLIGEGCEFCRFTGYKGRIGVYEVLIMNERIKDALVANKSSYDIRRICFDTSDMTTLLEDGLMKALKGQTSLDEVLRHLPRIVKPRPIHEIQRITGVK